MPKNHPTHLALAWLLPYTPDVAAAFGRLLSGEGAFYGALSYQRGRVRHCRIEAAQLTGEEGDGRTVTAQYDAETGTMSDTPKFLQDGAWLLDALMAVAPQGPIRCHAGFFYQNSPRLQTAFPLPFAMPDADGRFEPIDEIRGIHGYKHADMVNVYGYNFTLDRVDDDDIVMNLEFTINAGSAAKAPDSATGEAAFIARRLVFYT